MVALPKYAPSRMTVAELLDWAGDGTSTRYELVDGELRAMAPASITHGIIQANIARLLGDHLLDTPCHVVVAPGVVPRARAHQNMRIPDLAVTCEPDEQGQRSLPEPILIIEILSPSNETETRENVWAYLTIPSVRHILMVRSTEVAAELLTRQADGSWPDDPIPIGPTDGVGLDGLDFTASLIDFYRGTHLTRTS
jgi:Uma2 family endonuclease